MTDRVTTQLHGHLGRRQILKIIRTGITTTFIAPLISSLSACHEQPTPQLQTPDSDTEGVESTFQADNPMLHQNGRRIVDGDDNPINLNGVNVGGWLIWEGWIWGGGLHSETQLTSGFTSLVGEEGAATFRQAIYDNFITEADFNRIAQIGFNTVRVPFNHRILEDDNMPYQYKQSGWDIIDRVVGWAEKYNLYVILEMHAAPGGQAKFFAMDPDVNNLLWYSEENKARAISLWRSIAERYRENPHIAGYDLLGEPFPPSHDELIALYRRMIKEIRQVDRHHLIILQGTNFATDFSLFSKPLDPNQAYGFHMYTILGDFRKAEMKRHVKVSEEHNVPLWCGEYGEDSYKKLKGTVEILTHPDNIVNGQAFWTWKKVASRLPLNKPPLNAIKLTENWRKVIDWVTLPLLNRKPSREQALQGMEEFIHSVRIENTVEDHQLISVLIEKP